MKGEFEMSVMGELSFILGLQVKQKSIVKRFSRNLKWRVAKKQALLCHQAATWMQMLLEKG